MYGVEIIFADVCVCVHVFGVYVCMCLERMCACVWSVCVHVFGAYVDAHIPLKTHTCIF